jgi:subtilisin-like proprotein convertase family protein
MRGLGLLVLCASLLVPLDGLAEDVPGTMTSQGVLRNAAGDVVNGYYKLHFRFWDAQEDGILLWNETQDDVLVENGVYYALLGAVTPFSATLFEDHTDMWLGISVENEPELPRIKITSVAYAFQSRSAVTAATALDLQCNGCVNDDMLGFNPVTTDDLAAGDLVVGGSVTAAAFIGDGSGLTGITSPQGTCVDGWFIAGIGADGALLCQEVGPTVTSIDGLTGGTINGDVEIGGTLTVNGSDVCTMDANCGETLAQLTCEEDQLAVWNGDNWSCTDFGDVFDPSMLPADALNEISNNLLYNQFEDAYDSDAVVPITDNNPIGVDDMITVPDNGLAQDLTVTVNISNSDISTLKVVLYDPVNVPYVLYDQGLEGDSLVATYPSPDQPVSGDLTAWIDENPVGVWRLEVIDTGWLNNDTDGQVNSWSVNVQTLSTQKVEVKGDLIVEGNIISAGGEGISIDNDGNVDISGDLTVDGTVTGDVTAYTNPYGHVFTFWGSKSCPAAADKLYDGAVFGSHYTHPGSPDSICVKGGDPGPTTSYDGDLLYPINTTGSGSLPPGVPQNKTLFCAVCQWDEGQCFELWGSDTCPNGWETVFNGFSVGPHHTHSSPGNRVCLDPQNFDTSMGTTSNGYLYTTRVQSASFGGNWPSGRTLKCAMCCMGQPE